MIVTEAKRQKNYRRNSSVRRLRIVSQIFFLALWFVLFLLTNRYTQIEWLNAYLIFDPLVQFVSIALSGVAAYSIVFPLLIVVLTLLTGRTFCGWVCPMGTIIDLYEVIMPGVLRGELHDRLPRLFRNRHHIKYFILVAIVVMTIFGYQFLLVLDPLVIMNRSMTAFLYPILTWMEPGINKGVTITVYGAAGAIGFFAAILAMNHIHSRFWCRVLCPLGALLGVISRFSIAGRSAPGCVQCTRCDTQCPTGAIDESDANRFSKIECIMCMDCDVTCPFDINKLSWLNIKNLVQQSDDIPLSIPRRQFFGSVAVGLTAIPFVHANGKIPYGQKSKLRPPHSQMDDDDFTSQCVRCWECIKSCPTNVLQPDMASFLDFKNLWTPVFEPAAGACMVECNACSDVCPTTAIQKYDITKKFDVRVGTAVFDANKCVVYKGKACNRCVDVCPTNAIPTAPVAGTELTGPTKVDYDPCVGCGWCEFVCQDIVIDEIPAIVVSAFGRGQIAAVNPEYRPVGGKPSRNKAP